MTKKDLENFYLLKNQIDNLEKELVRIDKACAKHLKNNATSVELVTLKTSLEDNINKKLKEYYKNYETFLLAINKLCGKHHVVIVLRYLKGFKWEEIAEILHYSTRQVHRLHQEALDILNK